MAVRADLAWVDDGINAPNKHGHVVDENVVVWVDLGRGRRYKRGDDRESGEHHAGSVMLVVKERGELENNQ